MEKESNLQTFLSLFQEEAVTSPGSDTPSPLKTLHLYSKKGTTPKVCVLVWRNYFQPAQILVFDLLLIEATTQRLLYAPDPVTGMLLVSDLVRTGGRFGMPLPHFYLSIAYSAPTPPDSPLAAGVWELVDSPGEVTIREY